MMSDRQAEQEREEEMYPIFLRNLMTVAIYNGVEIATAQGTPANASLTKGDSDTKDIGIRLEALADLEKFSEP